MPRLRARSMSENRPSGLTRAAIRSAPARSCSGPNSVPMDASCFSAASRVSASTASGNTSKNLRMIRTCSSPRRPSRNAWATYGSAGRRGSPVNARRGPRCAASARRRRAVAVVIERCRASTSANDVPPNATGEPRCTSRAVSVCEAAVILRCAISSCLSAESNSGLLSSSNDDSTTAVAVVSRSSIGLTPEGYARRPTAGRGYPQPRWLSTN